MERAWETERDWEDAERERARVDDEWVPEQETCWGCRRLWPEDMLRPGSGPLAGLCPRCEAAELVRLEGARG